MGWEPAWRSLVRQLVDEGHESPYLERLRERYDVRLPNETIERELLREMSSALGRAEDKVDVKLLELELLGRRCDERGDRRSALAFNAKREEAKRAKRDLLIHRDALRFRRDPGFDGRYPIPPPRDVPDQ